MAGKGPAPKAADQRARRNATYAMTKLPAEGRKGRAPKWPLGGDLELETKIHLAQREIVAHQEELEWAGSARDRAALRRKIARVRKVIAESQAMLKFAAKTEREIWAELWKSPQAVQWERRGWFRDVALYARHQAKAEGGSLDDSKEARQREDRLGLNDLALLRLRWEIVDASPATGMRPRARRSSSRYGNLRVVASQ